MKEDVLRKRDLARIHLAAKEAGLDDDAYRDVLKGATNKTSSRDLTARERFQVLLALSKLGAKSAMPKSFPGRPAAGGLDRDPLIRKIEAQLAEASRPWEYAHSMARHMFGVDLVQWCNADQLRSIVAALTYDARRHKRNEA